MASKDKLKDIWPTSGRPGGVDIIVEISDENAVVLAGCYADHSDSEGEDESRVEEAFRAFDRDGDGYLTRSDLAAVLTALGVTLTESELQELVSEADVDHDDRISYHEFSRMMLMSSREPTSVTLLRRGRSNLGATSRHTATPSGGQRHHTATPPDGHRHHAATPPGEHRQATTETPSGNRQNSKVTSVNRSQTSSSRDQPDVLSSCSDH